MSRRGGLRLLPSGAWQIRYRGPDGSRYSETIGTDEKQAERALTARLREIDTGEWREPSRESLQQYGKRWIERKRPRLAKSTIAGYEGYLDRHVYPRLGARPLVTLRPADFDELAAELERDGKPAGTVRNCLVPVRAMLSDAVRLGLIAANPAIRVDLPPAPATTGREIPPEHTAAIRQALVDLAPPDPLRPEARDLVGPLAFDVAIGTGLRWSELAGLRWRACDFDGRTITVAEAVVLGESKAPKSGHARTLPMFPSVHEALRGLAARALERGRYGPDEYVLARDRGGGPPDPSNWHHRVWRPALAKAKLETFGYRWHELRHSAVSRLVGQGADIAVVQAIAGHSSAATTLKVYTHLRDGRLREAADRFDPGHVRGTPAEAVIEGDDGNR